MGTENLEIDNKDLQTWAQVESLPEGEKLQAVLDWQRAGSISEPLHPQHATAERIGALYVAYESVLQNNIKAGNPYKFVVETVYLGDFTEGGEGVPAQPNETRVRVEPADDKTTLWQIKDVSAKVKEAMKEVEIY